MTKKRTPVKIENPLPRPLTTAEALGPVTTADLGVTQRPETGTERPESGTGEPESETPIALNVTTTAEGDGPSVRVMTEQVGQHIKRGVDAALQADAHVTVHMDDRACELTALVTVPGHVQVEVRRSFMPGDNFKAHAGTLLDDVLKQRFIPLDAPEFGTFNASQHGLVGTDADPGDLTGEFVGFAGHDKPATLILANVDFPHDAPRAILRSLEAVKALPRVPHLPSYVKLYVQSECDRDITAFKDHGETRIVVFTFADEFATTSKVPQ